MAAWKSSSTTMKTPERILCHECDRGGRGNAKDKCACGWRVTAPSDLGCFSGTPIVGTPRPETKRTRSQERYRRYLGCSECWDSFRDFLLHGA